MVHHFSVKKMYSLRVIFRTNIDFDETYTTAQQWNSALIVSEIEKGTFTIKPRETAGFTIQISNQGGVTVWLAPGVHGDKLADLLMMILVPRDDEPLSFKLRSQGFTPKGAEYLAKCLWRGCNSPGDSKWIHWAVEAINEDKKMMDQFMDRLNSLEVTSRGEG
jgi:hypothetical protein